MRGDIETVADIVRVHARLTPDKPAVRFEGRTVTYRELDTLSNQVAHALAGAGIGSGDRVSFLAKNCLEYFAVLYGTANLGAVFVPVNWRLGAVEIAGVVNDGEATVLIVDRDHLATLTAVGDHLTTVKRVLVLGADDPDDDFARWHADEPTDDPGRTGGADDIAVLYYSSGTTGLPKGVMLTNANLVAHSAGAARTWRFHGDAVALAAMPLFHAGGGGWSLAATYAGATIELLREATPAAAWDALETRGVTHTFFVPAMILAMLNEGRDRRPAALEILLYGASPISEQVLRDGIRTFGHVFLQSYGLTESSGAVVHLLPEEHDPDGPRAHLLRAAGRPDPGIELRIADPDHGYDLPPGEVGEILLRSALTMRGYWKRPDETTRAIAADGWLRTGDAGFVDEEGYLYIHDRMKDMIITGGENVFPAEVENALMSHPAVADVAVIGVPHDKWGETPKALVVRAEGADDVTASTLIEHCGGLLARYKCPTSVEWVETLPRNAAGKILKKDLRAAYWAGRDRSVS